MALIGFLFRKEGIQITQMKIANPLNQIQNKVSNFKREANFWINFYYNLEGHVMTSGYSIFLVRIDFIDLYVQWKISFSEKRDIIQTGTFYVIDSNKVGLHFLSEGENLGNTFYSILQSEKRRILYCTFYCFTMYLRSRCKT